MPSPGSARSANNSWQVLAVNPTNGALKHLLTFIDEQVVQVTSLSQLSRGDFSESETLRLQTERRLETTAQACCTTTRPRRRATRQALNNLTAPLRVSARKMGLEPQ